MRIAHVCLAAFYIDGYGYQENILPRIHSRMGHEVIIIASTETYLENTKLGYVDPSAYVNEDGIPVYRLAYSRFVPRVLQKKIRAYEGLAELLDTFKPDLIFLHDVQFWDILTVKAYALKTRTPVHADSHTDYINSAQSLISRYILHGMYYRMLVRCADPVIRRYFPTLPIRGDFLRDVYGLSESKFTLLPFGIDDGAFSSLNRTKVRLDIRKMLGIEPDELVFVTGGKLDLRKNIHVLIESFSRLRREGALANTHLIVFGDPNVEVKSFLKLIEIDSNVHMLGWKKATEIAPLFWSADLALFPGTHSVLWEEAIGHGLAAVFHRWSRMCHLDLGGNAFFIDDGETATIDTTLQKLVADDALLIRQMNEIAQRKGPTAFAFSRIAQKAIEL